MAETLRVGLWVCRSVGRQKRVLVVREDGSRAFFEYLVPHRAPLTACHREYRRLRLRTGSISDRQHEQDFTSLESSVRPDRRHYMFHVKPPPLCPGPWAWFNGQ